MTVKREWVWTCDGCGAGAWAGKEDRPNARVAWWRVVDQTVAQS